MCSGKMDTLIVRHLYLHCNDLSDCQQEQQAGRGEGALSLELACIQVLLALLQAPHADAAARMR